MGVEVRSFKNQAADIEKVATALADSLMTDKGFALTSKGWGNEGFTVKLRKSGFLRQFSGLVYTFDISVQRQNDVMIVKVDDGDIRNQLASLGIAAFIFWPVLITAGFGWMQKGELRGEILNKAALLLR